ncbi:MAG: DUF86 domain-containing protein [Defluviitaleaceae bacterium]|nr:DUF86 domain-containing protein [Defluviitaleaceae bacterium]
MKDKDRYHLKRMLVFSRRIQRRIESMSVETFLEDEDLQDMILYAIGQVGENANNVSDATREMHPDILWNAIVGVRNRVL